MRVSSAWVRATRTGMSSFGGVSIAVLASASLAFAQAPPPAPPPSPPPVQETVTVVGATPVPGINLPPEAVPAPVQTADAVEIDKSGALDLSAFLNRRLNGVHVNETQGNPFQPDVNYRGYTASPLLGTPQGLSLYMDGVRLNQPFGQVVSWDLVPRIAIASLALMPGSNPMFGLNTLGGALSVETKRGRTNRGTTIQGLYGSDVRRALEFESGGGHDDGLDWYIAGNVFAEDGWRDDSPSDVGQIFGKLGWHRDRSDVALTLSHADNSLTGNGLQSREFLDTSRASVYTKPDQTNNQSTLLNVTGTRQMRQSFLFSGNAFYRDIRSKTLNGDINEDSLDQSVYQPSAAEQAALAAAGYTGFPTSGENASNTPFPFWRCLGNVLLVDGPAETCNGLINRTRTNQHSSGAAGQIVHTTARGSRTNQLILGAAFEGSGSDFVQSTELGYLNPDRSVTGTGAFGDGVTGGEVDGEPFDTRVDLDGTMRTWSAYAMDAFSMGSAWHLTVSGRYDRTSLTNRDRIQPGGGPGSLDGDHTFSRLNPAAGLTFAPTAGLNVYAGYAEGSRAPTSIELGCADPEQPCKLPNAMAGDPPLDQVVTRTFESGIRSTPGRRLDWNIGFFHAENRDDILFVASEQTNFGYFKNFGSTRRQGLEMGLNARAGRVTIGAGYTYLDATFQSAETVSGTGNSSNDAAESGQPGLEGLIDIEPGNRMPLIPRHLFKLFADVPITSRLSLDVNLVGASGSPARGNENNLHEPDGTYYLSEGSTPGYGVTNVGIKYQLIAKLEVIVDISNLFDEAYSTGAQLGPTGFTSAGNFIARPFPPIGGQFPVRQTTFEAPGAPRTFWVGLRLRP